MRTIFGTTGWSIFGRSAVGWSILLSLFLGWMPAQAQSDSATGKAKAIVLPLVARSIETDWSAGVAGSFTFNLGTHHARIRTSNLQALALYSLRRQFITAINGTIYFPGERYILNQQLSYSYFPDKFWGLGKVAPDEQVEPYTFRQYYIYLHLQRQLRPNLFLGLLYEYQRLLQVDYQSGGLFDQQNVAGRKGYGVSGAGLSLTYDSRNNAFSPDKGLFLQAFFNHFTPVLGSDYRYTNYVVDARRFIRVYRQQVLALQAYGFFNGGDVPLRSLASFGGSNSMRGYYDGRYRAKNQALVQAEYRLPVYWRFGVVAFGDVGNVGNRLSELNFHHLKYSYGAGLRVALLPRERLNLRVDYGIGQRPAHGLYFQLAEAF